MGSRHRRRPRALGSAPSRERGRRDRRNPPGPTARRRPGRTEDSPPRPRDPRGGGRGGRAVAPWEGRPGLHPKEGRRARRRVMSGSLGPGIRRAAAAKGAVTLGEGRLDAHGWAPSPPSHLPRRAFPAVPEPVAAHRRRWKCARRRPVAGRGAVPRRPHPRPRPRADADAAPPEGGDGNDDARVEGSGGTGSGKDPPGATRPDARRRVESSGRTARTPPVYLLTVSRPLELSLQSSFQLSLTVLVDYRSRAGI